MADLQVTFSTLAAEQGHMWLRVLIRDEEALEERFASWGFRATVRLNGPEDAVRETAREHAEDCAITMGEERPDFVKRYKPLEEQLLLAELAWRFEQVYIGLHNLGITGRVDSQALLARYSQPLSLEVHCHG